jgi:4-hydroxy-tetrahydrodipicolinate synthase
MLRGSLTALVTPFERGGAFDDKAFQEFGDWQIAGGHRCGLVPVGTTGESPTLSTMTSIKRVVEDSASKRCQGQGARRRRRRLQRHALRPSSLAAARRRRPARTPCLQVAPYYVTSRRNGGHLPALRHAIARRDRQLPILHLQRARPRSAIDMTRGDRRAAWPMLPRTSSASRMPPPTSSPCRPSTRMTWPAKDFVQLSGEDATTIPFMRNGGHGCISVTANVAPRLCSEFQEATLANDKEKALDLQDRLMPLHKAIFIEAGVTGSKYALSRLGKLENVVRSPLITIEESTAEKIDAAMKHAGLIN